MTLCLSCHTPLTDEDTLCDECFRRAPIGEWFTADQIPIRLTNRGQDTLTVITLAAAGLGLGLFLTLCYWLGSR